MSLEILVASNKCDLKHKQCILLPGRNLSPFELFYNLEYSVDGQKSFFPGATQLLTAHQNGILWKLTVNSGSLQKKLTLEAYNSGNLLWKLTLKAYSGSLQLWKLTTLEAYSQSLLWKLTTLEAYCKLHIRHRYNNNANIASPY